MSPPTSEHQDATGELVGGRYRLTRPLGRGGMGDVWEAWDERLERGVAVKRLHPQPGVSVEETEVATNRAMREARITARLHHPHAVTVYDVVEDRGQPCLVMQLVPSQPLSERLRGGAVLPVDEVARLGQDLASALAAAHDRGIVHRDVKPGNILMAQDGTARISDFGIAHAMGDVTLTSTGMVTGTPAYLAPEIARGEESGYAADVFSLGATLYTALEGRPPFGADTNPMALLHRVASGVVDPPERSGVLTPLLVEMLDPDPDERPTMAEVQQELGEYAGGPGPVVVPYDSDDTDDSDDAGDADDAEDDPAVTSVLPGTGGSDPGDRWLTEAATDPEPSAASRHRALWALVAAALLVVLAAGWFLTSRGSGAPASADGMATASPSSTGSGGAAATSAASPSNPGTTPPTTTSPTPAPTTASTPSTTTTSPASPASTTSPVVTAGTAEMTAALSSYYGLLPGGTDQGFPLLTAAYQNGKAGGRQGYQRFWDQFSGVRVSDIAAVVPGRVTATITYTFKDGRVQRERTVFVMVVDGGILKIDSSTVVG